ncbi:hypothetical protein C8Q76DRAFT_627048, partial [Earliella scabrosa]
FGSELHLLPNLSSIRFMDIPRGVPWGIIKICLSHPGVTSLSFERESHWTSVDPFPEDAFSSTHALHLSKLSYTPPVWRELMSTLNRFRAIDLTAAYALEASCLDTLVSHMSQSAKCLVLPFETAPIDRMAQLNWPRLRELSLYGRYTSPSQVTLLPALLSDLMSRMPALRQLRVDVAQLPDCARAPILGRMLSTPRLKCPELRSLTVSYPDPEDAIFSILAPTLIHLSLRDWPRHYFHIHCPAETHAWVAPILSSSECLAILRRLESWQLESLELVYRADADEGNLLDYVSVSYPNLRSIELHRYRPHTDDAVPHVSRSSLHLLLGRWPLTVTTSSAAHVRRTTSHPRCATAADRAAPRQIPDARTCAPQPRLPGDDGAALLEQLRV